MLYEVFSAKKDARLGYRTPEVVAKVLKFLGEQEGRSEAQQADYMLTEALVNYAIQHKTTFLCLRIKFPSDFFSSPEKYLLFLKKPYQQKFFDEIEKIKQVFKDTNITHKNNLIYSFLLNFCPFKQVYDFENMPFQEQEKILNAIHPSEVLGVYFLSILFAFGIDPYILPPSLYAFDLHIIHFFKQFISFKKAYELIIQKDPINSFLPYRYDMNPAEFYGYNDPQIALLEQCLNIITEI